MVIAIDGPAGAGKSTLARTLAARLGFAYLDTGAMYRCVGLLWLRDRSADPVALARDARIDAGERVLLNGRDVSAEIRAAEVAEAASLLAADPLVREQLVARQRELARSGDWVIEGRDIASVVAPQAELKVFLAADARERARRRAREHCTEVKRDAGRDHVARLEQVQRELRRRDERDCAREHSPLRTAPGAVVIDTSALDAQQVAARVLALALGILGR